MSYRVYVISAKNPEWYRDIIVTRTKKDATKIVHRLRSFLDSYPDILVNLVEHEEDVQFIIDNSLVIANDIVREVESLESLKSSNDFNEAVEYHTDSAYGEELEAGIAPGEPLFRVEEPLNLTDMMKAFPVQENAYPDFIGD
jgi:hypothetical protein